MFGNIIEEKEWEKVFMQSGFKRVDINLILDDPDTFQETIKKTLDLRRSLHNFMVSELLKMQVESIVVDSS